MAVFEAMEKTHHAWRREAGVDNQHAILPRSGK
jgi:hypothetical protein